MIVNMIFASCRFLWDGNVFLGSFSVGDLGFVEG